MLGKNSASKYTGSRFFDWLSSTEKLPGSKDGGAPKKIRKYLSGERTVPIFSLTFKSDSAHALYTSASELDSPGSCPCDDRQLRRKDSHRPIRFGLSFVLSGGQPQSSHLGSAQAAQALPCSPRPADGFFGQSAASLAKQDDGQHARYEKRMDQIRQRQRSS